MTIVEGSNLSFFELLIFSFSIMKFKYKFVDWARVHSPSKDKKNVGVHVERGGAQSTLLVSRGVVCLDHFGKKN